MFDPVLIYKSISFLLFFWEHEVLNVIKERQKLDELYEENYKKQLTLLWQYIGSNSGVMSMYPGRCFIETLQLT